MIKQIIDEVLTVIENTGIAPAALAPWLPLIAEGVRLGPDIWKQIKDQLPEDPTLPELIEARNKLRPALKPVEVDDSNDGN